MEAHRLSDKEALTRHLASLCPVVSVLGSARINPTDKLYHLALLLGQQLAFQGYTVMTGGGSGIMEAVSIGVKRAGSRHVGLVVASSDPVQTASDDFIYLPSVASRKDAFIQHSQAIVCLPGGFGTLDELSDILLSKQSHSHRSLPVILLGSDFWAPMLDWLTDQMLGLSLIDPADLCHMTLLDDISTVMKKLDEQIHETGCD